MSNDDTTMRRTDRRDARIDAIRERLTQTRDERPDWLYARDVTNAGVAHILDVLATAEAEVERLQAENDLLAHDYNATATEMIAHRNTAQRLEAQAALLRQITPVDRLARNHPYRYSDTSGMLACCYCSAPNDEPHNSDCAWQNAQRPAIWQTPVAPDDAPFGAPTLLCACRVCGTVTLCSLERMGYECNTCHVADSQASNVETC